VDLLHAARDDVTITRYRSFGELMPHVRRSANPIGRLLLHLSGTAPPRSLALSDGVCSSLWLIGVLRDLPLDYAKGRLFLPLEEMERYGVKETQIAGHDGGGGWGPLMLFQIERARKMLQAGASLGQDGCFGFRARALIIAGERLLKKLHEARGDVFRSRPVLGVHDWPYIFGRALFPRLRP